MVEKIQESQHSVMITDKTDFYLFMKAWPKSNLVPRVKSNFIDIKKHFLLHERDEMWQEEFDLLFLRFFASGIPASLFVPPLLLDLDKNPFERVEDSEENFIKINWQSFSQSLTMWWLGCLISGSCLVIELLRTYSSFCIKKAKEKAKGKVRSRRQRESLVTYYVWCFIFLHRPLLVF